MTSLEHAGRNMQRRSLPVGAGGPDALTVARQLARSAGRLAKDRLDTDHLVRHKGKADLVTDVDLSAQQLIVDGLSGEHSIM